MRLLKFIAIFTIAILVASCESNTYEDISGEIPMEPTYEANVKQVISANCLSCHSVATDNQSPNLETYEAVKDAVINEGLLGQISAPSGEGMPSAGRLPQTQIDLVTFWAENGFPEE